MWDYNKWEEDREDWNHELWLKEQEARRKAQIDAKIKSEGLYTIPIGNGREQLSFFPPITKKNEAANNYEQLNQDEDENGI